MSTTTIDLSSGTLKFGNAKTGNVHEFDMMILQLTIEGAEGRHNLKADDNGRITATAEFLMDLANAIDGLGFDGCTPTQAYQIWVAAASSINTLKKNMLQSLNLASGITPTPETSPPKNESDIKQTSAG